MLRLDLPYWIEGSYVPESLAKINRVLRDHRTWIDSVCSVAKVRDAIITDGACWTTHRKGSQQLKQQVWNLDHAVALGNIDEMLGDLAEGL